MKRTFNQWRTSNTPGEGSLIRRCLLLLGAALACVIAHGGEAAPGQKYSERSEVIEFARELARTDGFTERGLLMVFNQAVYKQSIIDAISRPAEKTLNWGEYQDIFLTTARVQGGLAFLRDHQDALKKAYRVYGVPASIVTAVIGVETMYGRNRGRFRVLDALITLTFDYPPRSQFFRKELREFLILVREENQHITDLLGSYAGAMGYGQFIPSSYRRYAVDFNGDGSRDIWQDPVDAIGSVANYLSEHGWRDGEQVVIPVALDIRAGDREIFNQSLKPNLRVSDLPATGILLEEQLSTSLLVSPLMFDGKAGPEYWLALQNFYVITRYNHSKLYAMAVYQLSQALAAAKLAAN